LANYLSTPLHRWHPGSYLRGKYHSTSPVNSLTLIQTCGNFRNTIKNAKTVWVEVVKDLLTVSPNGMMQRWLPHANGAQLRSVALRYNTINRALSAKDLSHALEISSVALEPPMEDALMIPASSVLLHITAIGSLHMTSSDTGETILSWFPPEPLALDSAYLGIYCSPTLGIILMARIFQKRFVARVRDSWYYAKHTNPTVVSIHPLLYPAFGSSKS
jgi:hypothetical protein